MSLSARRPKILLPDIGSGVPDRRQSVLVVTTTTLAIATTFVAARLVSRLTIVRRTGWDVSKFSDYLIPYSVANSGVLVPDSALNRTSSK